jgi:peptidoglycan hydrolase-like protein with peptidoglycan-binding domain
MASPLPILLGLGALLLVASGNSSSSSSDLSTTSAAYKAGYADGYKDGLANKPVKTNEEAQKTPEATASGNPKDYALGYLTGRVAGAAARAKSGTGAGTGTGMSTVDGCRTSDATAPLMDYQRALIAAGSLPAINSKTGKTNADGVCGPMTRAAVSDFQVKRGLTASGIIDKATAAQLQPLIPAKSARAAKSYSLVVPTDWGLFGPFGTDVFLHVGTGLPEGSYRAKVNAKPSGAQYVITGVIENPGGVDIQAGDKGDLYTKAADGSWVLTLPPS